MDVKDCIKFANENEVCYLATNENDQPRVRALAFWFADQTGFYFQTGNMKPFYNQLQINPKTEVCFFKVEDSVGKMLRITGEVEFVDNKELKTKAINDRPYLKSFGLSENSPELILFKIPHGEAHFWTMATNLKPKEIITF